MNPKTFKAKTGEDYIIREVVKSDAQNLIDYVNQVAGETNFLTFGAGEFKMSVEQEERFIENRHKTNNQIFLLAEMNSEVIGLMNVNASQKTRLKHIGEFGISIKKKHWGKGIGSRMIETMINWAKSSRIIRKLNLTVNTDNKTAIALYKKFGFEIEGTLRRNKMVDGTFGNSYMMGLLID